MYINRFILNILLVLLLLLTTGCVRGDIVLDISRTGSAELSSKLMVASVLRENLKPVRDKFVQDGFAVMDVKETGMEGFHAVRRFDSIADMKNLAVFTGLNVQDSLLGDQQTAPITEKVAKEPKLVVERGLLFDKYRIDTNIDLGNRYGFSTKDDNIIVKNIMSQVNLNFTLKLPTKTSKNNAYQVSEDGRTLVWHLAIGEDNQVVAEAEILNLWHVGILVAILLVGGGYLYLKDRQRKSRGILARRKQPIK